MNTYIDEPEEIIVTPDIQEKMDKIGEIISQES